MMKMLRKSESAEARPQDNHPHLFVIHHAHTLSGSG
jgi:hypothetical protein